MQVGKGARAVIPTFNCRVLCGLGAGEQSDYCKQGFALANLHTTTEAHIQNLMYIVSAPCAQLNMHKRTKTYTNECSQTRTHASTHI
jgi:hypothetical protein